MMGHHTLRPSAQTVRPMTMSSAARLPCSSAALRRRTSLSSDGPAQSRLPHHAAPCASAQRIARRLPGRRGMVCSAGKSDEGPRKTSMDLDALAEEIAKLDMDKVTETFGGNFGPQPDAVPLKTVEQVKEEMKDVIDLSEAGGVFDLPDGVQLPLEPVEMKDEAEKLEVDEEEGEDDVDDEDEEYSKLLDQLSEVDPIKDATEEEMTRKGQVLLRLINSGQRFEEVLEESLHEVDDLLLRMLDGRIAQAESDKEDLEVVQGLGFLFDRLAMEKDRLDAPEEMQLLDACLAIMIPEDVNEDLDTSNLGQRRLEVLSLLEESFALPGADGRNIDILGLAAMIGPQQDLDIDKLEAAKIYGSNISRESFVHAVEQTVYEVEDKQRTEFLTLKRWSDEIEASSEHGDREKAVMKAQVQEMSRSLIGQRKVLTMTKEVLDLARSIEWS